ncbi:MAG: DUF1292 domain-containing protein [Butyrivibrio sp.]
MCNFDEEYEDDTVTLTLDDDTEVECAIVSIFPAGDRQYIALLPLGGEEEANGEVYLYRYVEDENGEPGLENIEDDDEYETAADAFDELEDAAEYDEIVSEEDL